MSGNVFIEFIKRVGERDKMRGLPNILYLFRKALNKVNNTRARMIHYTGPLKKLFHYAIFQKFFHILKKTQKWTKFYHA